MVENLEKLLDNNSETEKPNILTKLKGLYRKSITKLKEQYREKIDGLRPYIAALGALSIGVANWSKDFAYNLKVVVPFLYSYFSVKGHLWYDLAFTQEAFTVGAITATSDKKLKTAKYAIAYESGSIVNAFLYYTTLNIYPFGSYYGDIWNDIFFFYQIPMFFMMLRTYLKKRPNASVSLDKDQKKI